MKKQILILTHGTHVWADNMETMFKDIGYASDVISLRHGDIFPENIEEYSAIVIMGGMMGVYEIEEYPWLKQEIQELEKALKLNIPALGICLGSQILAHIHGGTVHKGDYGMSVGFTPISVIESDPIFGNELHETPVCKWHGDRFTIPESATLIATSDPYPNQAVRFDSGVYGVQFHPEITPCRILNWYSATLTHLPDDVPTLESFIAESQTHAHLSHTWLKLFFCRLLDE
jgi:GMP synthase-like glutamine amidotransferase